MCLFTHQIAIIIAKIWKSPYLKKKSGVYVIVDNADTWFSNFAKTKNYAKSFLPFHMGPRSNLLSPKKWSKISWHCPFKVTIMFYPKPAQEANIFNSVSDPYSLNPDPANNLNSDPDPSYLLTLSKKNFLHNFIITRFSHQQKSIGRQNVVKVTNK